MPTTILPNDVASLKQMVLDRDGIITKQSEKIGTLQSLLALAKYKRFAPSSEKYTHPGQGTLFNEVEQEAPETKEDGETEKTAVSGHNRNRPRRKPLPDFLLREEIIIELPPEERRCPHDGHLMEEIGEEVSEKLDIIPASVKVIRTIRKKYACRQCEEAVKTAPVPPSAIPKGIATAGLLAFIAISKYCDALPLYRLEKILARCGVELHRNSMARWMIRVAQLLTPIIDLLVDDLLAGPVINCDETRVQVLNEPGKNPTSQSYMWVRARAGPGHPIVLFDYDPSRSGDVPVRLLRGFKGYLQVDGYGGYDKVCQLNDLKRVGCLAHCRRKFNDAIKAAPKASGKAQEGIAYIKRLYKVEKKCKSKKPEDVYRIRQEDSKPILDEMQKWLDESINKIPPKTLTGMALQYLDGEWSRVVRYIEDGRLNIDNNFAENAIRPFVMGRKAWMFSATVAGAQASATIYSIIETVKANGLEPYSYLRYVLEAIPKIKDAEEYKDLLPHNITAERIQNTAQK